MRPEHRLALAVMLCAALISSALMLRDSSITGLTVENFSTGVNQPPNYAGNLTWTTAVDTPFVIDLAPLFTDAENDSLTFIITEEDKVAVRMDASIATLIPELGFSGERVLTIITSDGTNIVRTLVKFVVGASEAPVIVEENITAPIIEENVTDITNATIAVPVLNETNITNETTFSVPVQPTARMYGLDEEVRDEANAVVGKKIADEVNYETSFVFIGIENNEFVLHFFHNASATLPVWIEGAQATLSANTAGPNEQVNLSVPLVSGQTPYFRLHVGFESEVFEFGTATPPPSEPTFTTAVAPTIAQVILNTTNPALNGSNDDLVLFIINATDPEGSPVQNITDWRVDGSSLAIINMPFETNTSNFTVAVIGDYSHRKQNGTLGLGAAAGSPTWVYADVGGGYKYDAVDDQINFTDPHDPTEYTLEAWIKPDLNTSRSILVRTTASGPTASWSHQLRITSAGRFEHYTFDGIGNTVTGTTPVEPNLTYHVVGTARNNNVMRLFVNGVEQGTPNAIGTIDVSGDRWRIGSNSGNGMNFYSGIIDEIRVYNRSLNATQIQQLFTDGNVSRRSTTWVSNETAPGQVWGACVTPNDNVSDGSTVCSNNVTILNYCQTFNSSTTLFNDVTSTATCMIFGANNIFLNCSGYNITFGADGGSTSYGILAMNRTNVTIRDCIIRDNNSLGDFNIGMGLTNANNSRVINSTILTNGSSDAHGILLNSSRNNTIHNNTIYTRGTASNNYGIYLTAAAALNDVALNIINTTGNGNNNSGIVLYQQADNNTIEGNVIVAGNGTLVTSNNHGIRLFAIANGNNVTNNSINTTGNLSHGISVENGVQRNRFVENNITTASTSSYGISILRSNNTIWSNNTLTNPVEWILSGANTLNNFTNTTFVSFNGRIRITEFAINGTQDVTRQRLNVTQNNAFLSSTNLTFMNISSQVTLEGITDTNPNPTVDFDDNGGFVPCPGSICAEISFVSGTFIFNVTQFTSFSSAEGGVNVTLTKTDSVDPVNVDEFLNYTLGINVSAGNASNITLTDLYPSQVIFLSSQPTNATGTNNTFIIGNLTSPSLFQVNVSVLVNNGTGGIVANNTANVTYQNNSGTVFFFNVTENTTILLPNCAVINKSTSLANSVSSTGTCITIGASNIFFNCSGFTITYGANGSTMAYGIEARNLTNITIRDCIIMDNNSLGAFGIGINFTNVSHSFIFNSTILTNGSNDAYGIHLFNSSNNSIQNNTIHTNGTTLAHGIFARADSDNVTIYNNLVRTRGTGITNNGIYVFTVSSDARILNNTVNATSSSAGAAVRVEADSHNAIIANNTLRGLSASANNWGVYLFTRVSNAFVAHNNISANATSGDFPIHLDTGSDNHTVMHNDINVSASLGTSNGIRLENSARNNVVANNTIVVARLGAGGQLGMLLSTTVVNNTIANNTILTNGTTGNVGIQVQTTARENFIYGNFIVTGGTAGSNDGIFLTSAQNNTIANNSINATGTTANRGIRLDTTVSNNTVVNNTVRTSGSTTLNIGIRVTGTAHDNNVSNNVVFTNGTTDNYGISLDTTASRNSVFNNTIHAGGSTINSIGILLDGVTASVTFSNITANVIYTAGTSNASGIALQTRADNNTIADNIIFAGNSSLVNVNSHGIRFFAVANGNNITNNRINTTGNLSHGISLESGMQRNRFVDNNISTTGTNSFAVHILRSNNTIWSNNTLTNPVEWILSGANTRNNFTNTTFVSFRGNIRITEFSLNGTLNISQQRLNVTQNNAFLNSTNLSLMNISAQITLDGITSADPEPTVDFEDDGSFVTCPASVCTEVSFANNVFVFNVTQFTSYSSQDATPSSCANITLNTTLTQNITSNGTCITVGANNVVLDCDGFAIFYDQDGTGGDGVVAVNRTSVTIRDCIIRDINASGAFGIGVNFTNSSNSVIVNNSIFTNGTNNNYGIYVTTTAARNVLENNTIRTQGSSSGNLGIFVRDSATENNVSHNVIVANGTTTNEGIRISDSSSGNSAVNNTINTSGTEGVNSGIVLVTTATGNRVVGNRIITNGTSANRGIHLEGSANNNTIANNSVTSGGISGSQNFGVFLFSTVIDNNITNNFVNTTGAAGGNDGIRLTTSVRRNSIENNTIITRGATIDNNGVTLLTDSSDNRIVGNRIFSNGTTFNDGIVTLSSSGNNTFENNSIFADGTSENHGISVGSSNNTFVSNNVTTRGTISYGIFVSDGNQSLFNHTILTNPSQWINTSATSTTNFSNTTFVSTNGSIRIIPSVQINGTQDVTQQRLNVSFNHTFLNSTNLTFFNNSAQITLNDITFVDPRPTVDFEDDGSFVTCPASVCTEVSFANNAFVFNVTSFTSFSSTEAQCSMIDASTTLTQNVTSTGTCFTFGASNLFLDCSGFTITYGTAGGNNSMGVNVTNRNNVTIRNCNIVKGNATSGARSYGIGLFNVSGARVANNSIVTNGTGENDGIHASGLQSVKTDIVTASGGINNPSCTGAAGVGPCNTCFTTGGVDCAFLGQAGCTDGSSIKTETLVRFNTTAVPTGGRIRIMGGEGVFCDLNGNSTASIVTDNNCGTLGSSTAIPASLFVVGQNNLTCSVQGWGTDEDNGFKLVSFSYDLLGGVMPNVTIVNNTITADGGNSSHGMFLNVENATVSNNTIASLGDALGHGIFLATGSVRNRVTINRITAEASGADALHVISATANTFINNTIVSATRAAAHLEDALNNVFNESLLPGSTSLFIDENNGSVNFTVELVFNQSINFSQVVNVSQNRTFVNATDAAGQLLNRSAMLTFLGITATEVNVVADLEDDGTFAACGAPRCTQKDHNVTSGILTFNVSSFSTYSSTPVSACGDLDLPFNVSATNVTLQNNVTSNSTCFNIIANNVTLDCANFVIHYTGNGSAVLAENRRNVTVKNCVIIDINASFAFGEAIVFINTSDSLLLNNSIQTNGTTNNYGILLANSSSNLLRNNSVRTLGTGSTNQGIRVENQSFSNTLDNNSIFTDGVGDFSDGIVLDTNASFNNVTMNLIFANSSAGSTSGNKGIKIDTRSNNNTVSNNTINVSATFIDGDGVFITASSTGNRIVNNTIRGFTALGRSQGIILTGNSENSTLAQNIIITRGAGANNDGIDITTSTNIDIIGNVINITVGGEAITFVTSVNNFILIENNTLDTSGTGSEGIALSTVTGTNFTIRRNNISATSNGIIVSGTATTSNIIIAFNNISSGSTGVRISSPGSNRSIMSNAIDGDSVGVAIEGGGASVENNTIIGGIDGVNVFNIGSSATNITGNNITSNGAGVGSIGVSLASAAVNITVENNNITSIDEAVDIASDGNRILRNNITTTGTTSNNFGIAASGDRNLVANNTVSTGSASVSANVGIRLSSSSHNTIITNNITTSGTSSNDGIELSSSSHNNTFMHNIIAARGTTSDNVGIQITTSSNNTASNNSITTNGTSDNIGIQAQATANRNFIVDNFIVTGGTAGSNDGIFLTSANNNTIANNTINTTGTTANRGIRLDATVSNNTVVNNTVRASGSTTNNVGILVRSVAHDNNISDNVVFTNGTTTNYGISIDTTASRNSVFNNTIHAGGSTTNNDGILLDGVTASVTFSSITRNVIYTSGNGNASGIVLDTRADNNTIADNVIFAGNGTLVSVNNFGIRLVSVANNNNITNNRINTTGNLSHGISVENGVQDNRLLQNNVTTTGTDSYGIQILRSNNTIWSNNTLTNPVEWILSGANTGNNFTNTTFVSFRGNIHITEFSLNGSQDVTMQRLNVTFNRAFLNSTNLSFLNTSAQITLAGITSTDPQPIVDFDDDNSFANCSSVICQRTGYVNNEYVFNVTGFTTYSTAEGNVNITLTKTDSPDPVNASAYLSYAISINVSAGNASNITLTDLYPPEVIFNSSAPQNVTGTNNTFIIGNLTPGSVFTANITVLVNNISNGVVINNTANISYQNVSGATLFFNVTENTTVSVIGPFNVTNITMTKTDAPDPVNAGAQLNYSIFVNVTGNGTAFNVTVNDTYPSQVIFNSAQPAPLTGTNNTFILGNLTAGTNFTINITLNVSSALINNTLTINNTANITFQNETSQAFQSRVATQGTTILTLAFNITNITITKIGAPDPVENGTQLNYTIVVNVTGNGTAFNVTVNDTFPAGIVVLNSSPQNLTGTNNTWILGNLTASTSFSINITVNVTEVANGTLINNSANVTFQNETSQAFQSRIANISTTVQNVTAGAPPAPAPAPTPGGGSAGGGGGGVILPAPEVEEPGCIETWECEQWSSCINGRMVRTCVELNNCNATEFLPHTEWPCVVEQPAEEVPSIVLQPLKPVIDLFKASLWKLVLAVMIIAVLTLVSWKAGQAMPTPRVPPEYQLQRVWKLVFPRRRKLPIMQPSRPAMPQLVRHKVVKGQKFYDKLYGIDKDLARLDHGSLPERLRERIERSELPRVPSEPIRVPKIELVESPLSIIRRFFAERKKRRAARVEPVQVPGLKPHVAGKEQKRFVGRLDELDRRLEQVGQGRVPESLRKRIEREQRLRRLPEATLGVPEPVAHKPRRAGLLEQLFGRKKLKLVKPPAVQKPEPIVVKPIQVKPVVLKPIAYEHRPHGERKDKILFERRLTGIDKELDKLERGRVKAKRTAEPQRLKIAPIKIEPVLQKKPSILKRLFAPRFSPEEFKVPKHVLPRPVVKPAPVKRQEPVTKPFVPQRIKEPKPIILKPIRQPGHHPHGISKDKERFKHQIDKIDSELARIGKARKQQVGLLRDKRFDDFERIERELEKAVRGKLPSSVERALAERQARRLREEKARLREEQEREEERKREEQRRKPRKPGLLSRFFAARREAHKAQPPEPRPVVLKPVPVPKPFVPKPIKLKPITVPRHEPHAPSKGRQLFRKRLDVLDREIERVKLKSRAKRPVEDNTYKDAKQIERELKRIAHSKFRIPKPRKFELPTPAPEPKEEKEEIKPAKTGLLGRLFAREHKAHKASAPAQKPQVLQPAPKPARELPKPKQVRVLTAEEIRTRAERAGRREKPKERAGFYKKLGGIDAELEKLDKKLKKRRN